MERAAADPDPRPLEMSGRMAGKVAVVTGGGSVGEGVGNGRAASVLMAREGADVLVVDRDQAAADATASLIRFEGGSASALRADVTKSDDCLAIASVARSLLGGADVLVNNVGIPGKKATVVEVEEDEWNRVISVNLSSMALTSKHLIPLIAERGGGAIVNVASIAAVRQPDRAAYAASKGGVIALTMAMAAQHARENIRVNCVAPGQVWTPVVSDTFPGDQDQIDQLRRKRRLSSLLKTEGTGWDVGNAILFFASEEARWITGQMLLVDGGLSIGRPPSEE
jgi:NAD(P)-dependent dehydrogenase (short-subunit alcohol dehydrogenase family)